MSQHANVTQACSEHTLLLADILKLYTEGLFTSKKLFLILSAKVEKFVQ